MGYLSEKNDKPARRFPAVRILQITAVVLGLGYVLFSSCVAFRKVDLVAPEDIVLAALEDNYAAKWSRKYTSEPHLAGTNYGLVQWTKDKFEEYGLKTEIDTYDIYVSYPDSHSLKLLGHKGKVLYDAPLKEDVIKEDWTSGGNDTVPTFLGYGANGNVTAEYVYVNYGTKDDFAYLKKIGVDVKGKIVIARYGKVFRGLKVKFAQDNGAVGVLLYTDPGDDYGITPANGYEQYPKGPARHESSVQRGSVQFLGGVGAAPGDPTTPGYASKGDVERQDPHASIGKIPALPISYREVQPILKKLNGQGHKAPKEWVGELEKFDYHIGPNPNVTLNLYSNQIYNVTPLWNVYGEFEGKNKDEVIIIGNHRDAWIKGGAGDPNSGSAALIEIARALGELKKSGYEFERSIILQSYDGEEYGLLGSTEFGEYAAKRLQKTVVAYLNMDSVAIGRFLRLEASPSVNHILKKVAQLLPYPVKSEGTLWDHYVKNRQGKIGNLGSGSDYTVFLEHLGIPSADISFSTGKGDAVYQYHSNYDSYYWMSHFGDKNFTFHNLAAKYLALVSLELSKHKIIDLSLKDYSSDLLTYFEALEDIIPKSWLGKVVSKPAMEEYISDSDENEEHVYEATSGRYFIKSHYIFPELMVLQKCKHYKGMNMMSIDESKQLTFGDVFYHTKKQLVGLVNTSKIFDNESENLQFQHENRSSLSLWKRIKLHFQVVHHNKLILYFERNFLHDHGLHERSWFKHIVFASGRFTGYAGQTWPGIREAFEDKDFNRAVKWLGIAAKAAKRAKHTIDL